MIANPPIRLEVDGGVNSVTAQLVAAARADTFVAGFALFKEGAKILCAQRRLHSCCCLHRSPLACIAHKSLEICERCRLCQRPLLNAYEV